MPDAPASTTPFLGLGQWNDGENPGATALNTNWTLVDTGVFSASLTNLTYSLPLEKNGTNLVLNVGNNLRVVGDNLETIQNIKITDAPQFAGINILTTSTPPSNMFLPASQPTFNMSAFYQMYSASAFLIGTDTLVGIDLSYQFQAIGNTWLNGDVRIGNFVGAFSIPSTHITTGSTYITGSVFSQEGHMWTRGNTIWGRLLARGETYISGNTYFGEKTLMNGPLYLAPGIVSESNPNADNTASWEDTFQASQDRADAEEIALKSETIPDPDPTNDLILYVSGNSFFKGQVEIQGGFTSSNGAFSYDATTGQMVVTSISISGSETIAIDADTGGLILGTSESTASFGAITVTDIQYISGAINPKQDESATRHLMVSDGKLGLIMWASGSAVHDTASVALKGIQPDMGGFVIEATNSTRVASGSLFIGQIIPSQETDVFSAIGTFGQLFAADGVNSKFSVAKGADVVDTNGVITWDYPLDIIETAIFNVIDGSVLYDNITPLMYVYQRTTLATPVTFDVQGQAGALEVTTAPGVVIKGPSGLEIPDSGILSMLGGTFYQEDAKVTLYKSGVTPNELGMLNIETAGGGSQDVMLSLDIQGTPSSPPMQFIGEGADLGRGIQEGFWMSGGGGISIDGANAGILFDDGTERIFLANTNGVSITGSLNISGSVTRVGKAIPAYHGNLSDEPLIDVQGGDTYYNNESGSVFFFANSTWLKITA